MSISINDGGPAFPHESSPMTHMGMSLRDYFAANAMQGMLAGAERGLDADIAKYAYKLADAMLRAREQTK